MGCDIHFYVEYKSQDSKSWSSFGKRFRPGRNYTLFGFLAGVRGQGPAVVPPRGYPNDADWDTNEDFYYWIDDKRPDDYEKRTVTLKRAESWGTTIIYDNNGTPKKVRDPDAHTPSWLTLDEYTSALILSEKDYRRMINEVDNTTLNELYKKDLHKYLVEYKAIAAAMESIEKAGYMTRIVFWFDN